MKAKISIESQCAGEAFTVTAEGGLDISDGCCRLEYTIDGDKCLLLCGNGEITQRREGEFTYSVTFKAGCICNFVFLEGGREFIRSVNVLRAAASVTGSGLKAAIAYEDGGLTQLTIQAVFI